VFDLYGLARGLAIGFAALSFVAAAPPGSQNARVVQRSSGGDVVTARKIAAALLARTLPAQLMRVRCERDTGHVDCGLIVSGTKFHRALDLASWNAEIAGLVASAYATVPELDEVDCWATVPLDAGKGAVVSGDFAQPTSATVFSIAVPRAERTAVPKRLAAGTGIFWDPAFRAALSKGTNG
jgi:hypothetical protein